MIIAFLIVLTALYVAAEFAAVSVRRTRIEQLADDGSRLANRLHVVLQDRTRLDEYIAACQVGITLASLLLGVVGELQVAEALAPWLVELGLASAAAQHTLATTLTLMVLTGLQMVLGELLPKSVALRFPEKTALWTVPPMSWSLTLMRWPIAFFNGSGNLLLRTLRVPTGTHHHLLSPEEIRSLISESYKGGQLGKQERQFLENLLRFTKRRVHEVMVPRVRIVGVELETPLSEMLIFVAQSPFSRLPVYRRDLDHIEGVLHIKDLVHLQVTAQSDEPEPDLASLFRPVLYIPRAAEAGNLLRQMQEKQIHLAIVVDEYGGTAGLVTLEDLLEEIIGEVQDEFDEEIPPFRQLRDGRFRIRGDVPLADVNERCGVSFDTSTASTLGGFMMAVLGRVPEINDTVSLPQGDLQLVFVDGQGIQVLALRKNES